ncbi:L,D-transpeptidase family protein [Legionella micdadei]|nr:L,D-transpeptidase family protein [Legionella micdadei]
MQKTNVLFLFFIVVIFPFTVFAMDKTTSRCQFLLAQLNLPKRTSQVIVVSSLSGYKAKIMACQRQGKRWQRIRPPFNAVIGKSGIARIGKKKEGDLKTPAGLYRLGEAFGSQPLALKMDYKYITKDDKFIDDVNSKDYNQWINGKTKAKSYEPMLVKSYKMGVIVNYNTDPVVPGAGSAIFMHLWTSANSPTAGCIAMDEPHLLAILRWLDKNQHPYILIRKD